MGLCVNDWSLVTFWVTTSRASQAWWFRDTLGEGVLSSRRLKDIIVQNFPRLRDAWGEGVQSILRDTLEWKCTENLKSLGGDAQSSVRLIHNINTLAWFVVDLLNATHIVQGYLTDIDSTKVDPSAIMPGRRRISNVRINRNTNISKFP